MCSSRYALASSVAKYAAAVPMVSIDSPFSASAAGNVTP